MPPDRLSLAGVVKNAQGQGIAGVRVEVLVNGQALTVDSREDWLSDEQGSFSVRLALPAGDLAGGQMELRVAKPSWKTIVVPVRVIPMDYEGAGPKNFQALVRLTLERQTTPALGLATLILLGVLVVICLNCLHRALAALLGAAAMLFISYTLGHYNPAFFIISFEEAIAAIDMNVILLCLGLMIIVGIIKKTGLLPWLAVKAQTRARGRIFFLVITLMGLTAVASAFLDNVTVMLLLVPVTIEIAAALNLDPFSLLLPEVFAASLGGAATLIGDPANILIGSHANLTFGAFVSNLAPICALCLILVAVFFLYWYREEYRQAAAAPLRRSLEGLETEYRLTNGRLLAMALVSLGFCLLLFMCQGVLHLKPSVAVLMAAILLVVISRVDIVDILEREVQWPTLIFFMALFMVVAGAEATGLLQFLAEGVGQAAQGNAPLAILLVLWSSALISAFLDNIPFIAMMLPIMTFLNATVPGVEGGVLWWALALGACLGGNGALTGASANVVTVGLAARCGHHLSFLAYLKTCFIPMLLTIGLCSGYLLFFR